MKVKQEKDQTIFAVILWNEKEMLRTEVNYL